MWIVVFILVLGAGTMTYRAATDYKTKRQRIGRITIRPSLAQMQPWHPFFRKDMPCRFEPSCVVKGADMKMHLR